jgi:zinc protease
MAERDDRHAAGIPAVDWTAARIPSRVAHLANGLTVVAHRDSKAPVVAVYVAYRAGSRDEPASKAGLAHLCEHLMFCGTKTLPGPYFLLFERAGAAWMNAFVKEDYSAYFATVPAGALDFALWMEADRMAYLAEALEAETVDRQREVVRNELRQRESAPYGCVTRIIAELAHPHGHPYAHQPNGLLEKLDNISTRDVREWIETRHVAANATVVVAGDVEPEGAIEKARRHFETVGSGPAIARSACPGMVAVGASRRVVEQAFEHTRLYIVWNGPGFASTDYLALEVACELLGGGKSSRFWRRLVETERLVSQVAVELRPRELGSQVVLWMTAHAGVAPGAIEAATRAELERLSSDGANHHELDVARLRLFARLIRYIERVGGPRSKSDALGLAMMLGGSPDLHDGRLSALAAIGPAAIVATMHRWLGPDYAVLEMRAAT